MKVHAVPLAACCGLVLLALWLGTTVHATSEARVEGVTARVDGQRLLVSCQLVGAFDESFRQRLASGLPTPLVYRFVLERERRRWFDKNVARSRLQVVAMFNAVTSEYLINFKHDGDLVQSRVIRDVEDLRTAMTELVDFPLFQALDLKADEAYRLKVRAELGTKTVLALIPRTLSTDWVRSESLTAGGG